MKHWGRMAACSTVFFLAVTGITLHASDAAARAGNCALTAAQKPDQVEVHLQRASCNGEANCDRMQTEEPASAFTGFALPDLKREGAHLDAAFVAEAGRLTCSGTVHVGKLRGEYTFQPDQAFVEHMRRMGFGDLDTDKLEAYTLFRIDTRWIRSLQDEGVTGLDSGKLIALRIFKVDAAYVKSLQALGYPTPPADKLVALSVQHVNPDEVKKVRAMGFQPTLDELIQMRIFKVTPEFIERMRGRGFSDLTISKLVQIRIFDLAE